MIDKAPFHHMIKITIIKKSIHLECELSKNGRLLLEARGRHERASAAWRGQPFQEDGHAVGQPGQPTLRLAPAFHKVGRQRLTFQPCIVCLTSHIIHTQTMMSETCEAKRALNRKDFKHPTLVMVHELSELTLPLLRGLIPVCFEHGRQALHMQSHEAANARQL